jgi:hypothetical protein
MERVFVILSIFHQGGVKGEVEDVVAAAAVAEVDVAGRGCDGFDPAGIEQVAVGRNVQDFHEGGDFGR